MFGFAHFNDLLTASRALNEVSISAGSITDCMETPGSETIRVKMYSQQHTNFSNSEGCC